MRMTRSQMLEVIREDYIRTARAKGLAERLVVTRHALRNALIPVVTILGYQIAALLGGSVILEQIFGLPGMGQQLVRSVLSRLPRQNRYPHHAYPVTQRAAQSGIRSLALPSGIQGLANGHEIEISL